MAIETGNCLVLSEYLQRDKNDTDPKSAADANAALRKYTTLDSWTPKYRLGKMDQKIRRVPKEITDKVFIVPEDGLPGVTAFLVSGATDNFLKAKILHDWICDNIACDTDMYFSAQGISRQDYVSVLKRKKAVCAGYAALFNRMCELAGITSVDRKGMSATFTFDVPDSKEYAGSIFARFANEIRLQDKVDIDTFENDWLPRAEQLFSATDIKDRKITETELNFFKTSYFKIEENGAYYFLEDQFDAPRNAAVLKIQNPARSSDDRLNKSRRYGDIARSVKRFQQARRNNRRHVFLLYEKRTDRQLRINLGNTVQYRYVGDLGNEGRRYAVLEFGAIRGHKIRRSLPWGTRSRGFSVSGLTSRTRSASGS